MKELLKEIGKAGILLSIVDGKLKIYSDGSEIDSKVLDLVREKKEEIFSYLIQNNLGSINELEYKSIPTISLNYYYPISDAQRRLWVLSQFEGGSIAYNIPHTSYFQINIDIPSFKKAVYSTIDRHEILRTVFREDEHGEVRQFVLNGDDLGFVIESKDYRNEKDREQKVREYISEDSYKAFDLEKGPLMRAALLQVEDERYVFYYNMHHIISDGWSMDILRKDVFAYYEAYKENKPVELKPLRIQYKDYSAWQLSQLEEESFKSHRDYWLKSLEGELPVLDLPSSKHRPKVKTNNGHGLSTYIDSAITGKLKKYSESNGGSLFMGLLAAWNILMYRYTSQSDIIIGTPVAGREHADLEDQIGFYVNTLALRNEINSQEDFNSFYKRLKDNTLRSFSHQMYPFDRLVEELSLQRDTSRSAVFDVMLILQNNGEKINEFELREEEINQIVDQGYSTSKFDIDLSVQEIGNYLSMNIGYNSDVYEREMVEDLLKHYKQLLGALLDEPHKKISQIDYLSKDEKEVLLTRFNDTEVDYPKDKTIVELFVEQVNNTPDNVAVVFEDRELSYKELDERSNQLADYLQKHYDIKPDDLVGIKQERSEWIIISILGILKSGGAYVPIDPDYPQERIDYIEKDTKCKVCIDENELKIFRDNENTYSKKKISSSSKPNNLAYVMYTSGSTGKPKGTMIEHGSLMNYLMYALSSYWNNPKYLNFGLFTSLSFDLTVTSTYLPLIRGGKLLVFDPTLDISSVLKTYFKSDIELIKLTPAHVSLLKAIDIHHSSIQVAILGGDAVDKSSIETLKKINPRIEIYNEYGPTESTVGCTVAKLIFGEKGISIGKPISNTQIYILNESNQLQPIGVIGEICIGGAGLARGYLNQEDLTKEKFIQNPFTNKERIYKTGDLGRWTKEGIIEFIGRKDDQVKIRGYRIELGEIEHALLKHDEIESAVVLSKASKNNEKELVAYITSKTEQNTSELRSYLKELLPDYMLPSYYIQLESLPLNTNGKVDKKSLPDPDGLGLISGIEYVSPRNEIEERLLKIWEEILLKGKQDIGIDDGFFTLGGNSIKLLSLKSKIEREFKVDCAVASLFKYSTIRLQADMLSKENPVENAIEEKLNELSSVFQPGGNKDNSTDIAVIGMSIRAPGSSNIREYWENLRNGKESITHFSREELLSFGIAENDLNSKDYIRANSYLEDKEYFDANFFGYLPDEAKLMDPQTRIFHEVVWSALEDSGYDPFSYKGLISLCAGAGSNIVWEAYSQVSNQGKIDAFTASNLSDKDLTNTLIAHKLNLRGPVNSISTACSTSLVAIHQAVRSLLTGESHIAIAGGVRVTNNRKEVGYIYQEGMIVSKDGHNRTFDVDSSGTVGGEGAGAVVLKKLSEAIKDGDQIYAVIKGSAINNDGTRKVGYTAPSVDGQTEVIRLAHKIAGVKPESISYIEAHGTATKLGDPIEVLALTYAFGKSKNKYCALGSVKSNLGHLDAAAGVAGFIKTVLCLKNKELVPSLHFTSPNPDINFNETPFYVNTELKEWSRENFPRRAGVSAFGIGGTNAHVILEEAPDMNINIQEPSLQLLTLSARSSGALIRQRDNLKSFLKENKGINLQDVAWTLQNRHDFSYRSSFVAHTLSEAVECLETIDNIKAQVVQSKGKKIAFMFPGGGSQYENMGLGLYEDKQSIFRKTMDECFEVAKTLSTIDFKNILYPNIPDKTKQINEIVNALPILFIFEYSLAKQIEFYGVKPDIMIGHSMGEYVAACFAGTLTLEGALKTVITRAELMQGLPHGSMLAVELSADAIKNYLPKELDIAAINSPTGCVVSGNKESIIELAKRFEKEEISAKQLHISHAAHSVMMDPILESFTKVIEKIEIQLPKIPYVSNLTGKRITSKELSDKTYWSSHIRNTVQFSSGVEEILADENIVLIEVGPGHALSSFAREHFTKNSQAKVYQLVRHYKANENDSKFLLNRISDLWQSGLEINWSALHSSNTKSKIQLPTYPFEKIKYPMGENAIKMISDGLIKLHEEARLDESKWYYEPTWKRCKLNPHSDISHPDDWYLIFCDQGKVGQDLICLPEFKTDKIIVVKTGSEFKKISQYEFEFNPYNYNEYGKIFDELRIKDIHPAHIIHLLSFDQNPPNEIENIEKNKAFGFYSLLHIAKELNKLEKQLPINLSVITNYLEDVQMGESIHPTKSLISGIITIIGQENPVIKTKIIDISLTNNQLKGNVKLTQEIKSSIQTKFIAYRNNVRWIKDYNTIQISSSLSESESKIKSGGVYLITGGLGRLGYLLSKYMLEKYKTKLILVGRNDISGGYSSKDGIVDEEIKNGDQEKRVRLNTLQNIGDVLYYKTNISDIASMKKVVENAEGKFGEINGVIHAAAIAGGNSFKAINFLLVEECEKQFEPKISGTGVIEEIFQNKDLDFCLFTSSLSAIIGGKEFAAYASANSYLDYFCQKSLIKNSISVNFDGLNFNEELKDMSGLNSPEIIRAFETVLLIKDYPQIIVSVNNLEQRIRKWVYSEPDLIIKIDEEKSQFGFENEDRYDLSTTYVKPESETEKALCEMFQSFFGREVGVTDNFFELGGNSLKALTLVNRIHKKFNVELRIKIVHECPSIRDLGRKIDLVKNIDRMTKDSANMYFENEIEI